jgi:hypothetical protein
VIYVWSFGDYNGASYLVVNLMCPINMKKSSSPSNDGFYDIQWRSETHSVVFSIELSSYLSTIHPIILGAPSVKERLKFETERSKLAELFTDIGGALIWRDCLSLMKANALNVAGTAKEPSLIAFSMNNCCSELLKNSIDALILRHIASSDAPTKLEVHFKPAIDDGRLKLTVSDNCGGFPTNVIAFYNAALRKENLAEYKAAFKANVSTKNSEVLLGGQGLGLKILGGLIRYGTLMALDDESLEYKMTGVDTCILLSNSSIGAQITLEIPGVPIPKISIAEKMQPSKEAFLLTQFAAGSFAERLRQKRSVRETQRPMKRSADQAGLKNVQAAVVDAVDADEVMPLKFRKSPAVSRMRLTLFDATEPADDVIPSKLASSSNHGLNQSDEERTLTANNICK